VDDFPAQGFEQVVPYGGRIAEPLPVVTEFQKKVVDAILNEVAVRAEFAAVGKQCFVMALVQHSQCLLTPVAELPPYFFPGGLLHHTVQTLSAPKIEQSF
jgi:hypothetical protein